MTIDLNDPSYVFGLNLDGKGGCKPLTETDESAHWLHVEYGHPTTREWLLSCGLSEGVVQSMIRLDTRPRTVIFKEGTLIVIRGVNLNPGAHPEDMVSLRMWLEKDRLITVRQRRLMSVQATKAELDSGHGPMNVFDLMVRIIEQIAERISTFVDEIEEQLEDLEAVSQSSRDASLRSEISSSRRQIAGVRRYLAPQRDALESLYRHALSTSTEAQSFALREQTDRVVRYVEDLDLVREKALVLQEELMNLIMEEQNGRMYALSIVAAIFLPITFVTGVFGMNVAGLPGLEEPLAFSFVAGGMLVVAFLVGTYLRFKRWL